MEVLIFPGYGAESYPDYLYPDGNIPDFPYNRIGEVIEKIRETASSFSYENHQDLLSYLKNNKQAIVPSKENENEYYYWNKESKWLDTMKIVEINDSRCWTIDIYDGAEMIVYPDIFVLDKKIGYCKVIMEEVK